MPADKRLTLLEKAPGPSPWYWKSFPEVRGASGQRYAWTYHGSEGELAYLATLSLEQEPSTARLALNTYCLPFPVPPDRLGIWCPEPGGLRILCFDPDQLAAFSLGEIVGWFKQSNDRIYSTTPPLAEFEVSSSLAEGMHPIDIPQEFRSLDELLLSGHRPSRTRADAACNIYVVYPQAGLVEVLPQRWFTASEYEIGRQWIARLVRDPFSHGIVGECVRTGKFLLNTDGRDIAEWLERD